MEYAKDKKIFKELQDPEKQFIAVAVELVKILKMIDQRYNETLFEKVNGVMEKLERGEISFKEATQQIEIIDRDEDLKGIVESYGRIQKLYNEMMTLIPKNKKDRNGNLQN